MNNSAVLSETEKMGVCVVVFLFVYFLRFLGWPILKHKVLDGSQAWLPSVLIANSRHIEPNTGG